MSNTRAVGPADGPKTTVELTAEQVDRLQQALRWSKALGSPARLAILGALSSRLNEVVSYDEVAAAVRMPGLQIDREVRILADAGLVRVEEWAATPGQDPRPARFVLGRDYLKAAGLLTATLHQVVSQVAPARAAPVLDERSQVLARLMPQGRLLQWPVQYKRQVWVMEEVAKAFAPDRTYAEREVDAILKDIFPADHCTLRRCLIDLKLMRRESGVYWKPGPAPVGAQP